MDPEPLQLVAKGTGVYAEDLGRTAWPRHFATGERQCVGWTLAASDAESTDHNSREYARVASYMMPIRDALMCDIATLEESDWLSLTQILTLNDVKTKQDLSGTPPEHVYSTEGIYKLLKSGENFHPMMKYLEEAELELKCIAF